MLWFRYCPHKLLEEAQALGWVIVNTDTIYHHDHYSFLVEWPKKQDEEPPWPVKTPV